jgi:hypothetical protein
MRKARIAVVAVSPRRFPLALLGALPLWLAAGSLGVARAQARCGHCGHQGQETRAGWLAFFMLVAVLWMGLVLSAFAI